MKWEDAPRNRAAEAIMQYAAKYGLTYEEAKHELNH